MRVIVGCEFTQIVTAAYRAKGHEAYSCDILPTEGNPDWHFQDDIFNVLEKEKFDLGIFHPPCTYLSYAANRVWNEPGRCKKRLEALDFFRRLWEAPIEKICMENPRGCASPVIAKYSQEIQPYFFGDNHMKTIWLWLKNLPELIHYEDDTLFHEKTHIEKPKPSFIGKDGRAEYFHYGKNQKDRSRFFAGISEAMAEQWG